MANGSHNTLGDTIGTIRLIGKKGRIETFPQSQIKRVRLVRRADGYSVQFAVQAERHIDHQSTGKQVGIDVGLKSFYTDSNGNPVENPRESRASQSRSSNACIGGYLARSSARRTARRPVNAWRRGI